MFANMKVRNDKVVGLPWEGDDLRLGSILKTSLSIPGFLRIGVTRALFMEGA